MCEGSGVITWRQHLDLWIYLGEIQLKLKKATLEARRYHNQVDRIVKDYLKSIDPAVETNASSLPGAAPRWYPAGANESGGQAA
jgi:hypothetical protein